MAQSYNLENYKIPVIKQSAFNSGLAGGTLTPGQPYSIGDVQSSDIYTGTTAPTTATVGKVGDIFIALVNNKYNIYDCVAVNGSTYTWVIRPTARGLVADTSSATPTIANVEANTDYTFSTALTSLTVTAVENSMYSSTITFTAGSGITVTLPNTLVEIGAHATYTANKKYVITFWNGAYIVGEFNS